MGRVLADDPAQLDPVDVRCPSGRVAERDLVGALLQVDGDAHRPVVVPAPGVLEGDLPGLAVPDRDVGRTGHDVRVVGVAVVAAVVARVVDDEDVAAGGGRVDRELGGAVGAVAEPADVRTGGGVRQVDEH
jgi:hypothetical protein